jgi:IstB-like ATP binding protein
MKLLDRSNLYWYFACPFEDWGKLIGDVPAATAILDRLMEDAEVLKVTGKSYRLRRKSEAGPEPPVKEVRDRKEVSDSTDTSGDSRKKRTKGS